MCCKCPHLTLSLSAALLFVTHTSHAMQAKIAPETFGIHYRCEPYHLSDDALFVCHSLSILFSDKRQYSHMAELGPSGCKVTYDVHYHGAIMEVSWRYHETIMALACKHATILALSWNSSWQT